MDAARSLRRLNRRILQVYSARTTQALRAVLPLRLALPHFEPFLARNVAKEVEKDALVIRRAAEAHAAGAALERAALAPLLEDARAIDRGFLARLAGFPVTIVVPYAEIDPVRLQRMERLAQAVLRVLGARRAQGGLRAALQAAYPAAELERLVREVLLLYARETLLLSRAVQLPRPLALVREAVAERLLHTMEDAAVRLARDAAHAAYRPARAARERAKRV